MASGEGHGRLKKDDSGLNGEDKTIQARKGARTGKDAGARFARLVQRAHAISNPYYQDRLQDIVKAPKSHELRRWGVEELLSELNVLDHPDLSGETLSGLHAFLTSVHNFGGLVHKICGHTCCHGILLWAYVKLALLEASRVGDYFVKVSSVFSHLGSTSPRYYNYVRRYKRSEPLQKALCKYYGHVIVLCVVVLGFTQQKVLQQIAPDFVPGPEPDLQLCQNTVENDSKDVRLQISNASGVAAKKFRRDQQNEHHSKQHDPPDALESGSLKAPYWIKKYESKYGRNFGLDGSANEGSNFWKTILSMLDCLRSTGRFWRKKSSEPAEYTRSNNDRDDNRRYLAIILEEDHDYTSSAFEYEDTIRDQVNDIKRAPDLEADTSMK